MPPLKGVIQKVTCDDYIAAIGRDMDNASATLATKIRQHAPDELDRADGAGRNQMINLVVRQFLCRALQAVARIADHDIYPAESRERALHNLADSGRLGYVKHLDKEGVGIVLHEFGCLTDDIANGSDEAVAAFKKLFRKLVAEATADASNKPGRLFGFKPPIRCGLVRDGAERYCAALAVTSSMARSALSVRG
jgi:uncharacterized protein YjhX (UPF0386 family)